MARLNSSLRISRTFLTPASPWTLKRIGKIQSINNIIQLKHIVQMFTGKRRKQWYIHRKRDPRVQAGRWRQLLLRGRELWGRRFLCVFHHQDTPQRWSRAQRWLPRIKRRSVHEEECNTNTQLERTVKTAGNGCLYSDYLVLLIISTDPACQSYRTDLSVWIGVLINSALTEATTPSSCRPPWLDTKIPATPCLTASWASSAARKRENCSSIYHGLWWNQS